MKVTISKRQLWLALVIALIGVASCLWTNTATATIFIDDDFIAPNGTDNGGRAPSPVDLPGSTWTEVNGNDIESDVLQLNADQGAAISIATGGSYTKPTVFQISVDLNLNGLTHSSDAYEDGTSVWGIVLGFFPGSAAVGENRRAGLGILYTDSNTTSGEGELLLVNGLTIVQDLGPTGLPANGWYNLSYVVNTAVGSISDVTFDGNAIPVLSTALFTDGATEWAGFYQRPNDTGGGDTLMDNFIIETIIPEPSTLFLFGIGGAALWLWWRRDPQAM